MGFDPALDGSVVACPEAPRQKMRRSYRSPAVLDALVMALLAESNHPLSAYDLARRSCENGARMSPAQIYRVLDRLEAGGRIQRIELLSAWLPKRSDQQGFMVCHECHAAQMFPVDALQGTVDHLCETAGFLPSRVIFEVRGVCAGCASQGAPGDGAVGKGKPQRRPVRLKGLTAC